MAIATLTLIGCSTPKSTPRPQKAPTPAKAGAAGTVNLTPGYSTHYGPEPKREPQWYVQWTAGAHADLSQTADSGDKSTDQGGRIKIDYVKMEGVTGRLFDKNGKPASTFRSKTGVGDGNRQQLELVGDVHVLSPDLTSEMTCDRLVYDATAKVLRARGHVCVTGKVGTINTSELSATPDLKYVATPDMFSPPPPASRRR